MLSDGRALALAFAADLVFGDPAGFPHPVRAIGAVATRAESLARTFARGDALRERVAGVVLCGAIVGGTYAAARITLARARAFDARASFLAYVAIAWTTIATRDLLYEADSVVRALEADDLARARMRLARIVGRDTAALDASEIARATIETLAESACDGIVAPLLALAVGGAPLALAFKAVSTLDSMLGHIEAPYTHLGWASAKLDDIACYLPARIAALAIAACAPAGPGDARRAFDVLRNDGHRHRSPNAGRPEAAMAGALGVRLGGTNTYDGVPHHAEWLGASFPPPTPSDARAAMRVVAASSLLVALFAIALANLRTPPTQDRGRANRQDREPS